MKFIVNFLIFTIACSPVVFAQQPVKSVDIDFEQPSEFIIMDTVPADTLWQIGTPSKTIFNAAHGGQKAIMTDTLHDYPAGTKSSFILKITPDYIGTDTKLSFWHKFDTENGKDSGYVEVSYDNGISWEEMTNSYYNWDSVPIETDWTHKDSAGTFIDSNLKFSGSSNGWIHSTFHWAWYAPAKADKKNSSLVSETSDNDIYQFQPGLDTLLVRFTFYSDTVQTDHEGWMIDDMNIAKFRGGAAIDYRKAGNSSLLIHPVPVTNIASVSIDKSLKIQKYLIYDLHGREIMQSQVTETDFEINMSALPPGIYYLCVVCSNNKELVRKFSRK